MQNTIVILVLLLSTLSYGQYSPAILSFNAGEVSPLLELRSDIAKYNNACLTLQNMLVQTQGPVTRRPGTKYIAVVGNDDYPVRLIPFEYSKTDCYVLEFGHNYMRVFRSGAQVVKAYAAWVTKTSYVIGDLVTNGGNYYRCLIAHTSATFADDLAAGKWVVTAGATDLAYQIVTVFDYNEIFSIQYAQYANAMYIVDANDAPQKLTRTAHTSWTIANVNFTTGPFLDENEATTTITPSDITGTITLTASGSIFQTTHVGALWELRHRNAATSIKGTLTSNTSSASLGVEGAYTATTHGTWTGTITLERSFDSGTSWEAASPPTSSTADNNLLFSDSEGDTGVLYRFTMTGYVSGTCTYNLASSNYYKTGVAKITAYTSATIVTATVLSTLGAANSQWATKTAYVIGNVVSEGDDLYYRCLIAHTSGTFATDLAAGKWILISGATTKWSEGAWSSYRGWPQTLEFHEQRLMFGGSTSYPQTIWATATATGESDDYENMKDGIEDDDALTYVLPGQNPIQWILSQTYLLIGTLSNVGRWGSADDAAPITPLEPTNYRVQVHNGAAYMQAVLANDSILYLEREGKRIREIAYSLERDRYTSPDLTILAEHITGDGISQLAYQTRPDCILWAIREDGVLLSMTYERQQEVIAWARHVTTGTFESVCIIPGTDEDEVWVEVARTVSSATVRYIEQFQPRDYGDYQQDSWFVDSGLRFDGGAARNISAITLANPCQITVTVWPTDSAGTNLADGDQVRITGVVGTTELNGGVYTVDDASVANKTFTLDDSAGVGNINSTKFTAWKSGGTVERVENNFSNLSHLQGLALTILADGESQPSETVAAGAITIDVWANTVVAGLAYTSIVETMPVVLEYQSGSTAGKIGRVASVKVNFYKSLGTQYGINSSNLDDINFYEADEYADTMMSVYTGWKNLPWLHGQTSEATIYLSQAQPLPLTVRAIVPKVTFSER